MRAVTASRTAAIALGLLALAWLSPLRAQQEESTECKILAESWQETEMANIRMAVNNVGIIGNAFANGYDLCDNRSCRFPANSTVEHLFDGGLWVGGKLQSGQDAVSTGTMDNPTGWAPGASNSEFTTDEGISERSSFLSSENFSRQAVSHQDIIANFTDSNIVVPGTSSQIPGHDNPLDIGVHMEVYNWQLAFSNFFVVLDFTITNQGQEAIDSLHVGYWTDGVIRDVQASASLLGSTPFFNKGGNGYIDSLCLAYEFDATGDPGRTDSYFSTMFLGSYDQNNQFQHPSVDSTFNCNYQSWIFQGSDPDFFMPQSDAQRFIKMTTDMSEDEEWTNPDNPSQSLQSRLNQPSNRSNLLSVGPYGTLEPGESVQVTFAVVCAEKFEDGLPNTANTKAQRKNLTANAGWARQAYCGNDENCNGVIEEDEDDVNGDGSVEHWVLPTPPDVPMTRFVARENAVDIYWNENAAFSVDPISKEQDFEGYRIYTTSTGFDVDPDIASIEDDFKLIAEFDSAGNGIFYDVGFQKIRMGPNEDTTFTAEKRGLVNDGIVIEPGQEWSPDFKYTIDNLPDSWQKGVALTAFDRGDQVNNLSSLETVPTTNFKRLFPGKTPNKDMEANEPFVYPNPYYLQAAWEGQSGNNLENRRIMFANLPERCEITIMNTGGDLVDQFVHDGSYNGSDTRWYQSFAGGANQGPEQRSFSGGEHAWDLLSAENQVIARGLYLYVVEDLESGDTFQGKFAVIK